MNRKYATFTLFATSAVAATLIFLPPRGIAGAGALPTRSRCEDIARSLQKAVKFDAQASYWLELARCYAEPGSDPRECRSSANEERRELFDLARDQYDARLAACEALQEASYDPTVVPGEFSPTITNTFLPFTPGRTLIYEKTLGTSVEHIEVTTTAQTKVIDGITCAVVHDVVELDGIVIEDTEDWVAQHTSGAVWYFGETALNYDEEGFLEDIDGSWRSGKNGAKPGVLMPATPAVDDFYRQEYLVGEAEDLALVLGTSETITVAAGTFTGCLKTEEWTPIEPDHHEYKYYAPGVGLVLEVDTETGERLELIQIQG